MRKPYRPGTPTKPIFGATNANGETTSLPRLWVNYSNSANNALYRSRYSIFPRGVAGESDMMFGADRTADSTAAKAGILTSIEYPTGGTDTFDYELHKFQFGGVEQEGGGLRIRRITRSYDNGTQAPDRVRNFTYTQYLEGSAQSSGQLVNMPEFAYVRELPPSEYEVFFSNARTIGTTHGSFVGYTEVSEVEPGNGRTVYAYDFTVPVGTVNYGWNDPGFHGANSCDYQQSIAYQYDSQDQIVRSSTNHNFPFPQQPNYDWHRGSLKSVKLFDEQDHLVKATEYEYTVDDACVKIPSHKVGYINVVFTQNQQGAYMSFANSYVLSTRKRLSKTTTRLYDRDFSG